MTTRQELEIFRCGAAYYWNEAAQAVDCAERRYAEAMAQDLEQQVIALEKRLLVEPA